VSDLFGLDIAGLIHDNIKGAGGLLDGYVIRIVEGARDDNDLSAGPQRTEYNYNAHGMWEDYDHKDIDGVHVKDGFRKALVLGKSLPAGFVPRIGDEVQFEFERGIVRRVQRDPASATYTLHCGITDTVVFTQLPISDVVFVNTTNLTEAQVQAMVDAAVGNSGGGFSDNLGLPDEFDEDNAGVFYFGWNSDGNGNWLIFKQIQEDSSSTYANATNNSAHSSLNQAWPNRLTLTYSEAD